MKRTLKRYLKVAIALGCICMTSMACDELDEAMSDKMTCPGCAGLGVCYQCGGTGVCFGCLGTESLDMRCPLCHDSRKCDECRGNGKCPDCKGKGYITY